MADVLREDLLQKLNDLARHEGRSVDDLVEELLSRYATEPDTVEQYREGSLARLAAAGRDMPPLDAPDNVAELADDILNTEFADYLKERMNHDASSG